MSEWLFKTTIDECWTACKNAKNKYYLYMFLAYFQFSLNSLYHIHTRDIVEIVYLSGKVTLDPTETLHVYELD